MKSFCKHTEYKAISDILAPKWSTKVVKINVDKVSKDVEHYVIRFVEPSPQRIYGWFYMSGKMIRRHKIVPNGRGFVYEVPLDKREEFTPLKQCSHEV